MSGSDSRAQLDELIGLFDGDGARLGEFTLAERPLPAAYARLLDHHHHMTVTVEDYFRQSVSVEVLAADQAGDHYWRRILLRGDRDGRIFQFGLMRLNLAVLAPEVQAEVVGRGKPLGRILIEHNVLRQVERLDLWRVRMGPDLLRYFETTRPETIGRTALIHCDGEPAVELVEIVTPELEPEVRSA